MASLNIYGRGSAGLIVAGSSDFLVGSNFQSHSGSNLTLNSSLSTMLLKIAGNTVFTITASGVSVSGGANYSGDGGGLTNLQTSALSGQTTVPNGGTGVGTLATHCVVFGRGTSAVALSSTGTSGQVLTSKGSSLDGDYADPITGTNSSASLATSTFALNQANGTFQDIGLSITLPSAGTYRVIAEVRSELQMTVGAGIITLKLQNSTDSTDIANSERMGANTTSTGIYFIHSTTIVEDIPVAASKVIKVLACRNSGTTYATSQIVSDTNGRSRIRYVKLNPT